MDAMSTRNRNILIVVIAAAILLLVGSTVGNVFSSAANGNSTSSACPVKTPHYYAYDATPGSNRFGPEQSDHSLSFLKQRFDTKLACDPLFAATLASFELDNVNIDPTTVEKTAGAIAGNQKAWNTLVQGVKDDVASYRVDNLNVTYETLAMVPGGSRSALPQLIKVDRPVELGYTLTLVLKDGSMRYLRVECDLQPSAPHFPHMPKRPPHPGPNCTTNGTCPSPNCKTTGTCPSPNCKQTGTCPPSNCHTRGTCPSPGCKQTGTCPNPGCTKPPAPGGIGYSYNPVTCTWYKPPQSVDCMLNGGPNCPPNGGHQPVQDNPCNCTGPTKGAGPEPSPLPTGPTPTNGSPAPPPNGSGYDSGSGDGSGVPTGTTCNGGSCSGGGPSNPNPGPTDTSNGGDNNSGGNNNPPPPG